MKILASIVVGALLLGCTLALGCAHSQARSQTVSSFDHEGLPISEPNPAVPPPNVPGVAVAWDANSQNQVEGLESVSNIPPGIIAGIPEGWTAIATSKLGSFALCVKNPETDINADGSIVHGVEVLRWPLVSTVIALMQANPPSANLVYVVISLPTNGTLRDGVTVITGADLPYSLAGSDVIYEPVSGFSGVDSFTYKVNDGFEDSNVSSVTVTVASINHPPTSQDIVITVDEDSVGNLVQLVATDPDA